MSTPSEALESAEAAAYEYMLELLDGVDGNNAFLGGPPLPGVYNAWGFWFSGGPEPELSWGNSSYQGASWRMEAHLSGLYAERANARAVMGSLMAGLPKGKNHGDTPPAHVQTLRLALMPTLEREGFIPDGTEKVAIGWRVVALMDVVFDVTA